MMAAILNWVNDLPQWFQMMFMSGFTFSAMALIYMAMKRGLKLKTSKGEVQVGGDAGPGGAVVGTPKKKSPHSGCPNAKDIVVILNRAMQILTRKLEIKNYETIRQQISVAEDRISAAVLMAQATFIDLLKAKGVEHVTTSDSFEFYRLVLSGLKDSLLREFREIFRDTKIAEQDEATYGEFTERKIDLIIGRTTLFLNDGYRYQKDVHREELYDANMESVTRYKSLIREVFQHARRFSQEGCREMNRLDAELEAIIKDAVGE